MRIFLNTEIHRIMNMNQYVKQKMNLEFGYHMEFYCEEMCGAEERDDGTIEDFKLMFDLLWRGRWRRRVRPMMRRWRGGWI